MLARLFYEQNDFLLTCFQCLIKIVYNVGRIFNSDRDPDVVGADSRCNLHFSRKLRVGGCGRMDDEGFGIANISQMAGQFDTVNEFGAGYSTALDTKAHNRTLAVR